MTYHGVDVDSPLDCDFCESMHPLGKPGVCNFTTLSCDCPSGYNGIDDWLPYSGCQVDISFRRNIHYFLAYGSIAGFLSSFICYCILIRKWQFRVLPKFISQSLPSMSSSQSNTASNSKSKSRADESIYSIPHFVELRNSRSLHAVAVRNWKRRMCVLYSLIFYMIYFFGGLIYFFKLLEDESKTRDDSVQAIVGFYIIFASSCVIALLLILIWYFSLPDLSFYADLLKMNKFLVRFPNFIGDSFLYASIITHILFLVTCLIIPLSTSDFRVLHIADLVTLITQIFITFVGFVNFTLLITTVQQVFELAINTFKPGTTVNTEIDLIRQQELEFMKLALGPVKQAKWTNSLLMFLTCVLVAYNFATGATSIYLYININFATFVIMLVSQPIAFVAMEDYLTPKSLRTGPGTLQKKGEEKEDILEKTIDQSFQETKIINSML